MPSDRTIMIERFRDELGDWRICILTPFGARFHAPWALALEARLRESPARGADALERRRDRAPLRGRGAPPSTEEVLVPEPEEIEDLVVEQLGQTALFAARFRENAARALLLPRRRPERRRSGCSD